VNEVWGTIGGVNSPSPAVAPSSRAEQARRTRARILEVALRLFNDKGYDATSLQDIADEMGLTKPAVYYHYKGKGEMLRDIAQPVRKAMADLMARVRAARTSAERVDTLIDGLVEILIARRDVMRIVAQQPALRQDMHTALGIDRLVEYLIEGFFGPESPTLDQRFAVYSSAAFARGVWALGDVPEDVLRGVVERALRRVAAVR
jgi:AcrR family transcriptional regulator